MWRIPDTIIEKRDDVAFLSHVLKQVLDPESFIEQVERLYQSKDDSEDYLKFIDGRTFMRRSRARLIDGFNEGRVWFFSDITKLLELDHQARVDPLTGLHNRRYFNDRIGEFFSLYKRNKLVVSIVLFDLDVFKAVNDVYGHDTGDICWFY